VAHEEAARRQPVATTWAIKYRRLVLLQNESLASRNMSRQCLERVMHAERSAMDMDVQERSRGNVIPAYAGIQSP
jgi:hypothetical protein